MLIVCPNCKTKFSFDSSRVGSEGVNLRCSKCRAIFKVVRKAPESVKPTPSTALKADSSGMIKVLVANESPAFCAAIRKVLSSEPFDLFVFNDGKEAFEAIERLKPDVVLLDVALPSMYGFEICERVKKDEAMASIKIILIASIYDKTRYKRHPSSLYGADDYIEKHHIPDSLVAMIYRLAGNQKPVMPETDETSAPAEEEVQTSAHHPSSNEMAQQEDVREEIKLDEEKETVQADAKLAQSEPSEAHVKAKRLARIIVSDIFLYNHAKVEEGIRNGNLYELVSDDIREGKALYERRVPEELRSATTFLDDAFEEFIAKKKASLNL